jgi:serine/threonine protein kinase
MSEANIFMDLAEPPLFIDLNGAPIPYPVILGYGSSSVVIQANGNAVKTPLRHPDYRAREINENIGRIRLEQMVYTRLQPIANRPICPEVLKWIAFTQFNIELELMKAGTLRNLLDKALIEPPASKKKAWMRQLVRGLMYIHSCHVLVVDVKSRNILLTDDLMIRYCDFGESSYIPREVNMDTVNDCGYTVKIDVALLGAVFYEIATGNRCDVDLYDRGIRHNKVLRWPPRFLLPATAGVFYGGIIERCWRPIEEGGIRNARELDMAFERIEIGLDRSTEPVSL